jgi:hypothetical protein
LRARVRACRARTRGDCRRGPRRVHIALVRVG